MEETTSAGSGAAQPAEPTTEPQVTQVLDDGTARLTVTGELTDTARRPLVRALTELLLHEQSLRRVELDVAAVHFMNSAGLAVLVQLQKMAAPKAVQIVLVGPPAAVTRPLQLSGLWHRFSVVERDAAEE